MLKAKASRNGRPMIVIGLSYVNLERLKNDPDGYIMVWREEIGSDNDIMIFAGETEEKMAELVTGRKHKPPSKPKRN